MILCSSNFTIRRLSTTPPPLSRKPFRRPKTSNLPRPWPGLGRKTRKYLETKTKAPRRKSRTCIPLPVVQIIELPIIGLSFLVMSTVRMSSQPIPFDIGMERQKHGRYILADSHTLEACHITVEAVVIANTPAGVGILPESVIPMGSKSGS